MVSPASSSRFLLLRESQHHPPPPPTYTPPPASLSTWLCPKMTLHTEKESTFHNIIFKNALKYTWDSIRGSRAPPPGRPDNRRSSMASTSGCPGSSTVVVPESPEILQRCEWIDLAAQIWLCRRESSPTAQSLHPVFSRVSTWGVPPFLNG